MTRLSNEHHKLIVRGLIRKTNLKKRFDAEIARLGELAYKGYLDWQAEVYGRDLVDFIANMNPVHRRVLCCEVERIPFAAHRWQREEKLPVVTRLIRQERDGGYEDARYFLGSVLQFDHVSVCMSKSVWVPTVLPRGAYLCERPDADAMVAPLEALAKELQDTVDQLSDFLRSVYTVSVLKKLMPEAVEFAPSAARTVAVIPNPGSARAALARNGFPDEAEAIHV
jgi:hypothetical protein